MASTDPYTTSQTQLARLAWNGCITPSKKDDGTDQYSAKLLFPKDSTALPALKALATKCKADAFGPNPGFKVEGPFQDGNEKFNENPEKFAAYKDTVVVNFKSKFQPTVFLPDAKTTVNATNKHLFTEGCYVVVACNAFSWNYKNGMKRGVSLGLLSIQKVRDAGPNDPPIYAGGGITTAEQAGFTPAAANDPASYAAPATEGDDAW